jgi:hypothetical protein
LFSAGAAETSAPLPAQHRQACAVHALADQAGAEGRSRSANQRFSGRR